MDITVMGTGTVVPRLARRQSCAVVEAGGENVVLDLGNGSVRGMLHTNLDPFAVDRVFFTHFHPDHTSDIVPLLFALKYGAEEKRERPLVLYGPEPFEGFLGSIFRVWGDWLLDSFLEISELPHNCPSPLDLPGLSVTWAPAEHNPESIAYRLEAENGALVYTGDTEYSESVVGLAQGAHTLLIECSFPDNRPVSGHLTPKGVARIAHESEVRRVVLTHIYPPADAVNLVQEVGEGFEGEVAVAEDGTKFCV